MNNFSFMPEHFSIATLKQGKKEQPAYVRKQHTDRMARKKIISIFVPTHSLLHILERYSQWTNAKTKQGNSTRFQDIKGKHHVLHKLSAKGAILHEQEFGSLEKTFLTPTVRLKRRAYFMQMQQTVCSINMQVPWKSMHFNTTRTFTPIKAKKPQRKRKCARNQEPGWKSKQAQSLHVARRNDDTTNQRLHAFEGENHIYLPETCSLR